MKKIVFFFAVMLCSFVFGQEIKIISGDYGFIKNAKTIDVEIMLDNAQYQVENYNEAQFVDKILGTIKNNPKKSAADVEAWSANWQKYRAEGFADAFIKGANDKAGKIVTFGKNQNAPVKLLIDTKWIYTGWYGGMMMQPAKLTLDMKFVDAANPSKIYLELATDKVESAANNKDLVWEYGRVAGAFEGIGKQIGKTIKKSK